MSDIESSATKDGTQKIVKLRIDGASSAVNTVQDRPKGRGMSLVCPFPALECDMPVTFRGKEGGPPVRGTIHRIGVEDDPESGLPRLRLSIRTQEHDQRDTVLTSPPQELLENSGAQENTEAGSEPRTAPEVEAVPDEETPVRDVWTPKQDSWSSLELDLSEERIGHSDRGRSKKVQPKLPGASYLVEQDDEDPAWVSCGELPCAEEIMNRSRTRRRKKLAGAAIWMGIMLSAGTGIYSLDRAGVIDLTDVKSAVAGITVSAAEQPFEGDALQQMEADIRAQAVAQQSEVEKTPFAKQETAPGAEEPAERETDAGYAATHEGLHQEQGKQNVQREPFEETSKEAAVRAGGATESKKVETAATDEIATDGVEGSVNPNDVTLTLPTRWPAEYATAYRVRDPNGVVVDVPGGLVKREGWIDELNEHPMIRSVKALQRETGARFIVYVHGGLPRFMTTPEGKGVVLRLFHEGENSSNPIDEVAMLR